MANGAIRHGKGSEAYSGAVERMLLNDRRYHDSPVIDTMMAGNNDGKRPAVRQ